MHYNLIQRKHHFSGTKKKAQEQVYMHYCICYDNDWVSYVEMWLTEWSPLAGEQGDKLADQVTCNDGHCRVRIVLFHV
jgi:hypothetical protein